MPRLVEAESQPQINGAGVRCAEIAPARGTLRTALEAGLVNVVVVSSCEEMAAHVPAWDRLATAALESNPFYESWMLLPALRHLRQADNIRVVLVFAPEGDTVVGLPGTPQRLIGVFPLEPQSRFRWMPVPAARLWRHEFCFYSVPLLLAVRARQALTAFLDWLESADSGVDLVEFRCAVGSPFERLLSDLIRERKSRACLADSFQRALFRLARGGAVPVQTGLSGRHRKGLRRQERLLARLGKLEYVMLAPGDNVEPWIEQFLALELGGWKGHGQTALASRPEHRAFFETMVRGAFSRGRLMMLAILVGGRPVASKVNLLGDDGSFAFKIAFDEEYAKYSPGVLLELENTRALQLRGDVPWMDSCAIENHRMIDRLWTDRRRINSLLVATRGGLGRLIVAIFPSAKKGRNVLRSSFSALRSMLDPRKPRRNPTEATEHDAV